MPVTNGFQTYVTQVSPAFQLSAGKHVMQVTLDGNGPTAGMGNFNWFAVQAPATSASFTGGPQAIPGQIQIENFDTGGKGVAYWNGATYNGGGANYRPGRQWTSRTRLNWRRVRRGESQPGDWLNYTVNIAAARKYTLKVRVAADVGGGVIHIQGRWAAGDAADLGSGDGRVADVADAADS